MKTVELSIGLRSIELGAAAEDTRIQSVRFEIVTPDALTARTTAFTYMSLMLRPLSWSIARRAPGSSE